MAQHTETKPARKAMLEALGVDSYRVVPREQRPHRPTKPGAPPPPLVAPGMPGWRHAPAEAMPDEMRSRLQNSNLRTHVVYEKEGAPGVYRVIGRREKGDQTAIYARFRDGMVGMLPGARVRPTRPPEGRDDAHWVLDFSWTPACLKLPIVREYRHMMFLSRAASGCARDIASGAQKLWNRKLVERISSAAAGIQELADLGNGPAFARASSALYAAVSHTETAAQEGFPMQAIPGGAVAALREVEVSIAGYLRELEVAIQSGATEVPEHADDAEPEPAPAPVSARMLGESETDRIYRLLGDHM